MQKLQFLAFMSIIVLMTSCSPVRLAIYDYQKKHAYAMESKAVEESSASSKISSSKETAERKAWTDKAGKYIGSKYRYGSCEPGKGFDCSGLVYNVAKSQNVTLPRSSHAMASAGEHKPWKKSEPGDLIFFGDKNRINHVGIVEKNKGDEIWIIHSSSSNGVIRENILDSDYWKKRVMFAIDVTTL